MDISILLGVLLALALAATAWCAMALFKARSHAAALNTESAAARQLAEELRRNLENEIEENKRHIATVNAGVAEIAALKERIASMQREQERRDAEAAATRDTLEAEKARLQRESEERFKNLANEILDANSQKFKEQNAERLNEILNPLRNNLEEFKKTVNDNYSQEARQRFSLEERIKEMIELNQTIGREAKELTTALKGNSKVQGDWGEVILETILDKSGLKRDVHYTVQLTTDADGNTLRDESGRGLRPDVVIKYPDGRCVVIDSKVSLTAYVNMVNAAEAAQAEAYGRGHLESVRQHIKELSNKNYQDYVGEKNTDFVMMFIPNEAAYMAAMNLDPNIWQEAYDRRVLIISPTHLISVVRLVEQLWRQDDMKRNVLNIATESGKMYDKFVGFVEDLTKIEKSLDTTRLAFDSAMKKLKTGTGNLVGRAEKLRKMGAKTSKQLPQALLPDDEED